ncbi:pentapeptide repeat-containing protein [Piscicoccus intestinalis]|uniref:pentapeptide repeat-containing protein n=1 Tax=Piscicoccus intestinalis TaxID=746033 RepID=UPI0008395F7E|nr:pentapeptide repeat-containing protein [Piscicoccus intestinalis]
MPTRDEHGPRDADHASRDTPPDLAEFASDCARCTGLCCTALPYRRSREFAADKPAGRPCPHLGGDFGCRIHARLRAGGWPGCTEFECFGAGPKTVSLFAGRAWGDPMRPETADSPRAAAQFETFLALRPLQEARFHLRGNLLIAADLRRARLTRTDLLGADLRDADVRGADLSQALFLTQPQLNAAVGDGRTRVPTHLRHPAHWAAGAAV